MPRLARQKQKILYLARFLLEETDEDHPASVQDMIRFLEQNGIGAERKSIYSDLEELSAFGLDIVSVRGRTTGYFIGNRAFELPEVRLLVDAVQSSRFLTRKKSEDLIRKLQNLVSRREGAALRSHVFVAGRIKTMNESIYRNVDALGQAIEEKKKVCFRYFEWNAAGEKKLRRGGGEYRVSPYFLVWDDENYYLVALEEKGQIRHFRVDKMISIRKDESPRDGEDAFCSVSPAQYEKKTFGMFGGTEERVTLFCLEELAGVMFDRFGSDLVTRRREGGFEISVSVLVSPLFFSWLAGFGNRVKILSPLSVREKFLENLEEILKGYAEESGRDESEMQKNKFV